MVASHDKYFTLKNTSQVDIMSFKFGIFLSYIPENIRKGLARAAKRS